MLCGFKNGNHIQPGCLTSSEGVRIHSCERGMGCSVMESDTNADVVHIIPIITRSDGAEIPEIGAGGGKGDLDQKEELKTVDLANAGKLMELCAASIGNPDILANVLALLQRSINGDGRLEIDMHTQKQDRNRQADLSLNNLASILSFQASKSSIAKHPRNKTIRFPYSRHSSYSELRGLVKAFRPLDIIPCTVDESIWTPAVSMRSLFHDLCSGNIYRHDGEMLMVYELRLEQEDRAKRNRPETQRDAQDSDADADDDADNDDDANSSAKSEQTCLEGPNLTRIIGKPSKVNSMVAPNVIKDNATEIRKVTRGLISSPAHAGALSKDQPECGSGPLTRNDISITPISTIPNKTSNLTKRGGTGNIPA